MGVTISNDRHKIELKCKIIDNCLFIGVMNVIDELKNIVNSDDPKVAFHEAMEKDPLLWVRFLRRHDANIFHALFLDKDYDIKDEDIKEAIKQVADFFELPMPVIRKRAQTIVEVMTSENADECELFYNLQEMEKSGFNNREALKLALLHEMAHQYLFKSCFLLFENELWVQELAADLLVGGFSVLKGDVETGKYKYVVSRQKATLTHPDGKFREEIVVYARSNVEELLRQKKYHGIRDILLGLPAFVYSHYKELHESWESISIVDEMKMLEIPVESKPTNLDSLPDSNLLKQYFEERKNKKDDNDE